jgi:hypothetical protein
MQEKIDYSARKFVGKNKSFFLDFRKKISYDVLARNVSGAVSCDFLVSYYVLYKLAGWGAVSSTDGF